jgi:hypothetical protein
MTPIVISSRIFVPLSKKFSSPPQEWKDGRSFRKH